LSSTAASPTNLDNYNNTNNTNTDINANANATDDNVEIDNNNNNNNNNNSNERAMSDSFLDQDFSGSDDGRLRHVVERRRPSAGELGGPYALTESAPLSEEVPEVPSFIPFSADSTSTACWILRV